MSARHPTPWRAEGQGIHDRLRSEYWAVLDHNGIFVMDALDETTAREIVDAVNEYTRRENWRKKYIDRRMNDAARIEGLYADISDLEAERDRLRDIVRKTLHAIDALYTVAAPGAIVKEITPDRKCLDVPIGKIVVEARAAIGDGRP